MLLHHHHIHHSVSSVRMSEGAIGGQIIRFAVPLFIGNLFQQLYSTVDALIVGNMLGNTALAAVSSVGSLIFMLIGFVEGVFIGAGVAVSRYFGAGNRQKLSETVHTDLAFAFLAGAVLTLVGTVFSDDILRLMGTPEEIFPQAAVYLRIYFSGAIATALYNCCRGIMQAVGDSHHPLYYLIFSSVINTVLDVVFIAVFHGDVGSAALATVISQSVSALLCITRLLRTQEEHRVTLSKIRIVPPVFREIIHYGLPSGFQNSAIALANVLVQSNINAFGTMAVAGCGAYTKVEGFTFLPISSFVMALTTFIGQNLGAGKYDRAKKGARFGLLCAVGVAELIGILISLTMPLLIGAFTTEPEAIAYGVLKARTCAPFFCFLAATHCFAGVLRGAGKSIYPMACFLSVWGVGRVLYLTFLVPIFPTITTVNLVYPITWLITTCMLFVYYRRADWIHGFEKA